jgi:ABC-type Fe3+-hydroxamate transport system substrate-binding protein
MKKKLYIVLALTVLILSGCSSKKATNDDTKVLNSLTNSITVGKKFEPVTIDNQFDKPTTITSTTKKVVFVFTKNSGHITRALLDSKPDDYLSNKNIALIADISGMPSLIASMFAIPDLKKHKYSIMLIKNEEAAKKYKNDKYEDYIAVVGLDDLKITNIKLVSTATQLENELGK